MKKVIDVLLRESELLKYYLDKEKRFGNLKNRMTYLTLELEKGVHQLRVSKSIEKGYGHTLVKI